MSAALLQTVELSKSFPLGGGPFSSSPRKRIDAVRNITIGLQAGESVGLVGESGCGKSTLAKLMCRLIEPTSGSVLFDGKSIAEQLGRQLAVFRRSVQMVFQDPQSSLNPLLRIGDAVAEPMAIHGIACGRELRARTEKLLSEVGLDPALARRRPDALSGGERQRVGIARALGLNPKILICDEPVSSLDLPMQAQILKLLADLQTNRGLTLFFISHNLATISVIADRILVMRAGEILEEGPNPRLFIAPQHPYTQQLVKLASKTI